MAAAGDDQPEDVYWAQHVGTCVDLVRAADDGGLLAGAASLDEGLRSRGWNRGRRGGQWAPPAGTSAGALTQLTPPSVDLVVGDADDAALAAVLDELTDRLVEILGEPAERGPVWDTDQVDVLWERPDLTTVISLLPSTSRLIRNAPGVTPTGTLFLRLAGPDTGDIEEDPERARHLARHGSSAERWHLAGQGVLPEDVVELLDADADPGVVRAVRVGAERRAWVAALPPE